MTEAKIKIPATAKTAPYGYGVAPLGDYKTSQGDARGLGWLVLTSKTKEACLVKGAAKIPPGVDWVVLSFAQGVGNGPAERAGIVLGARKGTRAYNRDGKACAVPDALKGIIIKPAKPDGRKTDKMAGKSTAKPATRKPEAPITAAEAEAPKPEEAAEEAPGQMYRDSFAEGLMTLREANSMLAAIGADLIDA